MAKLTYNGVDLGNVAKIDVRDEPMNCGESNPYTVRTVTATIVIDDHKPPEEPHIVEVK